MAVSLPREMGKPSSGRDGTQMPDASSYLRGGSQGAQGSRVSGRGNPCAMTPDSGACFPRSACSARQGRWRRPAVPPGEGRHHPRPRSAVGHLTGWDGTRPRRSGSTSARGDGAENTFHARAAMREDPPMWRPFRSEPCIWPGSALAEPAELRTRRPVEAGCAGIIRARAFPNSEAHAECATPPQDPRNPEARACIRNA